MGKRGEPKRRGVREYEQDMFCEKNRIKERVVKQASEDPGFSHSS